MQIKFEESEGASPRSPLLKSPLKARKSIILDNEFIINKMLAKHGLSFSTAARHA